MSKVRQVLAYNDSPTRALPVLSKLVSVTREGEAPAEPRCVTWAGEAGVVKTDTIARENSVPVQMND
jgi:hypothetical protein